MEFLLAHASPELILIFLTIQSENHELLLQWFNNSANIIEQLPNQTAYFIHRLFKEIPLYKSLGVILTLVAELDEVSSLISEM